MKPSSCSTSSRRVRRRELGDLILFMRRIWPLRMRVMRSPIGSIIIGVSLPARLGHAGDLAEVGQRAQGDTAHLDLAVVTLRTTREFATVMDALLRGFARLFGLLEVRGETLLFRQLGVLGGSLQGGAAGGILGHQLFALLVAVDRACLSHWIQPLVRREGELEAFEQCPGLFVCLRGCVVFVVLVPFCFGLVVVVFVVL